jgi:transcriptional regulator with XRE-family HTH domain
MAKKYRELREARGMSTEEVSRRLGVDEAMVRRWESGEQEPDSAALAQLASTFGVSQDELRHEENLRHHPTEEG